MAKNQTDQDSFQLPSESLSKKTPEQVVSEIVVYIKSAVTLVFYLVLLTIALGVGYVVLRVTVWAANTITRAIGL